MKRFRSTVATALALLCMGLLVACIGPGGGGSLPVGDTVVSDVSTADGSKPVPAALVTFKAQLLTKYCEALLQCPGGSALSGFGYIIDSTNKCEQVFGPGFNDSTREIEAAIAAGEVTFNGAAGNACLATIGTTTICDGSGAGVASICADTFVGSAMEGGPCSHDASCIDELYCQFASDCEGSARPSRQRVRVAPPAMGAKTKVGVPGTAVTTRRRRRFSVTT